MTETDSERKSRIDRIRQSFFSSGIQYYVSGRYAIFAGLIPVSGNLLHHAVEMFLKGGLAASMDLGELKGLGHSLPKTWSAFKVRFGHLSLEGFDSVVDSLHAFEELRYPDSMIENGARIMAGPVAGPRLQDSEQIIPTPSYELYLSEIDLLVRVVLEVSAVNPGFFLAGLNSRATEYLNEANAKPWTG